MDGQHPHSIQNASSGCTIAFVITPYEPITDMTGDSDLAVNMMNAAVATGVRHVVFGANWTNNAADNVAAVANRFILGVTLVKILEEEFGLRWTEIRCGFFEKYTQPLSGLKTSDVKYLSLTFVCLQMIREALGA